MTRFSLFYFINKNFNKTLSINNTDNNKSLLFKRNVSLSDPDNSGEFNNKDNVTGFYYKLSRRFIKRFNMFLKSNKKTTIMLIIIIPVL